MVLSDIGIVGFNCSGDGSLARQELLGGIDFLIPK